MAKFKKILLIINPVSGRGTLRPKLWQILELFSNSGYITNLLFTEKRGDAMNFAKTCPKNVEMVICAGGDGTLNEVINGLLANPYPHKLGYIPSGTTNDLASSLNISPSPLQAAKDILNGRTESIDIGMFSGRYFSYIASFGAFTEASYNAPQEAKNILGHFAYVLEGVMSLANIRPYKVKFTFDGKTEEGDFIFAAISNTTSMGGVLKLKDTLVALNDGKFELLLVRNPENIAELNIIIGELLNQDFTGELVSMRRVSEITIESEEEIDWTLDGERYHGNLNEQVINIHKAINLIVPSSEQRIIANE